jgi:hypothetical protein
MAVNLATKYSSKIAKVFTLASVVEGKTNKDYEFTGVKSIHINTPTTQALNDYSRTGTSRYGTPTEMQDTDQEMILSKDRSFSITIDKGNYTEQQMVKKSGEMLRMEIDEQVIPEMDAYALKVFSDNAGTIDTNASAPDASTIVGLLSTGMVTLSNNKVPNSDRVIWIGWTYFGALRLSTEFIGIDALGAKSLTKGALGTFMGAEVIPVPDTYLKKSTSQCYFLIAHKSAIMQPKKIQDYFTHSNPPGINGWLIEGRFIFDSYVIGSKSIGVYALCANATQQAAPTATYTAATTVMDLTSTGATSIKYTLDGTDPRYSSTAVSVASGTDVDLSGYYGQTVTIKSVALDDALWTSDVTTTTQAVVDPS